MVSVSTNLNFNRKTERAFEFNRSVFGGSFTPVNRFSGGPALPGQPPLSAADQNLIMHIALPILGGHMLLGTDRPDTMGFKLTFGNKQYVNFEPDTQAETTTLFQDFATGSNVQTPLTDMFWGLYPAASRTNSAHSG